jgi:hypothetical protein
MASCRAASILRLAASRRRRWSHPAANPPMANPASSKNIDSSMEASPDPCSGESIGANATRRHCPTNPGAALISRTWRLRHGLGASKERRGLAGKLGRGQLSCTCAGAIGTSGSPTRAKHCSLTCRGGSCPSALTATSRRPHRRARGRLLRAGSPGWLTQPCHRLCCGMGHGFLSALDLLLVIHPCCSPPIFVSAIRNVAPLSRTGGLSLARCSSRLRWN